MRDINVILDEFAFAANNPRKNMDRYLSEGKKIVGCFPIYTPQPLVTALDMIPMGLWGGQVTPTVAGKYNPIYTCSIMRSCLEYGMTGVYHGLTAVIMPMLCDTFRGMSSGWRAGVKDIPIISFIHPQNRSDSGAEAFLEEEYKAVQEQLEHIAGKAIEEEKLNRSLDLYNARNTLMRTFIELANDHLDIITPVVRHRVMKAVTFLEIQETLTLLRELNAVLESLPVHEWKGKRTILTGITAEPEEFLQIFADNHIAVVADDLAQESRQYRNDYPDGANAIQRLAKQWFEIGCCSTVYQEDKFQRGEVLVELAQDYDADCIAVCLMRFCDVEEYDYPYISQMAEKSGLYCLCLEIDQSTQDNGQSKTKIQSYAEI